MPTVATPDRIKKSLTSVRTKSQSQAALRYLQLGERLFRNLEAKSLIDEFFTEVQKDVPHDGIVYTNHRMGMTLSFGEQARHRLEYNINLADHELGKVVMSRSRLFTPKEIEVMEELLCTLVYPLRNATMYQLAMQSAFEDPLTRVHNRTSLENSLPREILLAQRHQTPLSLLVIDVDHFKQINDTHGHIVGDKVLKSLAGVFNQVVRSTDMVFRYGGDEFVISLPSTDLKGAAGVAERIRQGVERNKFNIGNVHLFLSASIGVTQITEDDSLESAFQRGDDALYRAKRDGRNRVMKVV